VLLYNEGKKVKELRGLVIIHDDFMVRVKRQEESK